MRIFMLGWEFPPFISGGLGTACYGLTRAMSRQNMHVTFVLPKVVDTEFGSHVKLLSPQSPLAAYGDRSPRSVASTYQLDSSERAIVDPAAEPGDFANVTFKAVPARLASPYQSAGGELHSAEEAGLTETGQTMEQAINQLDMVRSERERRERGERGAPGMAGRSPTADDYAGDLLQETRRYADLCLDLARDEKFDVIHAHDWLTYPAGMAVAGLTGKPLVVHVHSTEFDRAGENINPQVYHIERRGMHAATRVVCVSYLTASIVKHRYGVDEDKIEVVYNGIDNGRDPEGTTPSGTLIRRGDKIVLFLGRITMQKGPEYFVLAAKKVLEKVSDVKFIMAGSGDKARDITHLAVREGLANKVIFTGFLRGNDVERVFKMADVYVMPSVSEPFGIAPLEAISHDVPVIISKQSGVAEVLTHVLKVDFWDTDEMANKIVAVLRHPPLSSTLRRHADMELRSLTWDGAATRCREVYRAAMAVVKG